MCVLIARKSGSNWKPNEDERENAWQANPHGFGVGYALDGILYIGKALTIDHAQSLIACLPDNVPALLHWRYATHGSVSEANCHPFAFLGGAWIGAHNGVLSQQVCLPDKTDSESYLLSLTGNLSAKSIERDIASTGSKIVCISKKGKLIIANEHAPSASWRIKGEVWQSNDALDGWMQYTPFSSRNKLNYSKLYPIECEFCGRQGTYNNAKGETFCELCASDEEGGLLR